MQDEILKFDLPKTQSSYIKVIGVGGGGSNAVNHMYSQGITGVDFIICNTDAQSLEDSPVPTKIQLGKGGLGAGNMPQVARQAAIEKADEIKAIIEKNTQMLFITAGMGGGTGTGAAPVIAQIAKEVVLPEDDVNRILTVGIVTLPFSFEGRKRRQQAEEGIKELRKYVDSILIINNDKLREFGDLPLSKAFAKADNILTTAAKGIAEIITEKAYINIDFKDVNTVMRSSGVALMGSGIAEGENRAYKAIEQAITSPLLNDNDIKGARNILLYISSGSAEITMDEISDITDYILEESGSNADIIWGAGNDPKLGDSLMVTLIATGFEKENSFSFQNSVVQKTKHILTETAPQSEAPVAAPEPVNDDLVDFQVINKTETSTEEPLTFIFDTSVAETLTPSQTDFYPQKEQSPVAQSTDEPYLITKADESNKPEASTIASEPTEIEFEKPQQGGFLQRSRERIDKLKALSYIKTAEGLAHIEKVPAFERRNVKLNDVPHSSESEVSRYTLNDNGGETSIEIKQNNSFLHDNVD